MKLTRMVGSPIGPLELVGNGNAIVGLYMNPHKHGPADGLDWHDGADDAVLAEAARQLAEFFTGKRKAFELPLEPLGTEFQKRCWAELRKIPFGETISYGEMAKRVGDPSACRAVGAANGRNPISIVVPCHRVIGATGKLVGFGGGLDRKASLLAFERAICFEEAAGEFWGEGFLSSPQGSG
jgi:methylated-DNA-[protein]-cysteine S-methyltransferase